ncbi:MAG: sensor domain-containing diguanylate cyclase [Pseudomonadaceae bacterium]|nr:MAG: sensor domain-containing diguanylate cyclase [Pseudomonadaceae bacterium]
MHDDVLNKLAATINASQDLESLTRPLLEILQEISGLESTYLTSVNAGLSEQRVVYAYNSGSMLIPEGLSVPWSETLCKRALEEGVSYTDEADQRWAEVAAARELGIVTYLSEPLCAEGGELYGTLCGASRSPLPVSSKTRALLVMFARLLTLQIEREQLIKQLQAENRRFSEAALLDPLTGIPNRRALELELARAMASAGRNHLQVHLAFIDLDGFKAINDTYGHDAGDRFLLSFSASLNNGLRDGDFFARIGGDEFVFFCSSTQANSKTQRLAILRRLKKMTCGEFSIGEQVLSYAGPSIGMVSAQADEAAADLLKRADAAMYVEKQARKNTPDGTAKEAVEP